MTVDWARVSLQIAYLAGNSKRQVCLRLQPPPDNLFLFQSVIGRRYNTD